LPNAVIAQQITASFLGCQESKQSQGFMAVLLFTFPAFHDILYLQITQGAEL